MNSSVSCPSSIQGGTKARRWTAALVLNGLVALGLCAIVFSSGCSRSKSGRLIGYQRAFSLDFSQEVYSGRVVIELDDGVRVVAACDEGLAKQTIVGDRVVLVPAGEGWKVDHIERKAPAKGGPSLPDIH